MNYKKIKEVEVAVSNHQAKWQAMIRQRKLDFEFELWAMDALGSMPNPRMIDDIILDILLAKKMIKLWEKHKQRKIGLIIDGDEVALAIYEVFGA